jgi:hypothetical protein
MVREEDHDQDRRVLVVGEGVRLPVDPEEREVRGTVADLERVKPGWVVVVFAGVRGRDRERPARDEAEGHETEEG